MFLQDSQGVYRSEALLAFPWLEHGFGTRSTPVPPRVATLHQIHSSIALYADGRCGQVGDGDALITGKPGLLVAVKTADCLPVLLVDAARKRVAAVHSGWRGAITQVAMKALEAMQAHPEDVHAALGPAIGPCCFEVGPEVARQFAPWFPERFDLDRKTTLDLAEANRRQLIRAGVAESHIYTAGLCTVCGGEQFYSWRRERRRAGRMYSWIGIR